MKRPRFGLGPVLGLVVAAMMWLSSKPGHTEEIARVGERVRLRLANEQVVGTIQALDARVVRLGDSTTGKAVTYDLSSVLGSEVSRGHGSRGHNAGRGALIGGLVGAAVGALATSCLGDQGECGGAWIPIGAGVLGASGAALGALIGTAVSPGEIWKKAQLHSLHVAIMPIRAGVQVQATLGAPLAR